VTENRHDRLRKALRENLKRRKAQAKGRAVSTDDAADEAGADLDETSRPAPPAETKPSP